ncbi:MAG: hypothetical protein ACLUMK_04960 [Christensenellales bacterium]
MSASHVRQLIHDGQIEAIRRLCRKRRMPI